MKSVVIFLFTAAIASNVAAKEQKPSVTGTCDRTPVRIDFSEEGPGALWSDYLEFGGPDNWLKSIKWARVGKGPFVKIETEESGLVARGFYIPNCEIFGGYPWPIEVIADDGSVTSHKVLFGILNRGNFDSTSAD